jgi:hypothetical protein
MDHLGRNPNNYSSISGKGMQESQEEIKKLLKIKLT